MSFSFVVMRGHKRSPVAYRRLFCDLTRECATNSPLRNVILSGVHCMLTCWGYIVSLTQKHFYFIDYVLVVAWGG